MLLMPLMFRIASMQQSYNTGNAFTSSFSRIMENTMDEKTLHDIISNNLIQLMNQEHNHAPSMRYLSTCIGSNAGYVQKIASGKAFPSCDKLLAISNHYEIPVWSLLFDSRENSDLFDLILELSSSPKELYPAVLAHIAYLKSIKS